MREIINLNYNWLFNNEFYDEYIKDYNNVSGFELVDIPHNAVDISYNYFNESSLLIDCTYKKEIYIKDEWIDKNLVLQFEGISNISNIFINDEFVMTHKGAYTAFSCNITEYVKYGENNMITIYVDSHENNFVPPFGGEIDFLSFGGIYREVSLAVLDKACIDNIFVKTKDAVNSSILNLELELTTTEGMLEISIIDKELEIINTKVQISKNKMNVNLDLGKKTLWSIDNPYLYKVIVKLFQEDELIDEADERFGFREVKFEKDGFYLNQQKVKLIGLSRHQSYPYIGMAMPKRVQEEDADILKYQLGCNVVRCSNYPQSKHFLNRCDEIGLLVLEEIPGYQYIGNAEWKELSYGFVKSMIRKDRNHPSIILWGVRISGSKDNHEFYMKTNEIARGLDDTRQTTGVRNFSGSMLLEDVYAYDDYSYKANISSKRKATKGKHPYLVTAHNGYAYPTRPIDDEKRLYKHAYRHLNVINNIYNDNGISCVIGSSLFDYNSHYSQTCKDGISYYGVLDMYRNSKPASLIYASELSNNIILDITSSLESKYDNNLVYVITNCDYVKVYRNDELIGSFFPNNKEFKNLKHPPILINDFIGDLIEKHEGLSHKDSEIVKSIIKATIKYGNNLPLKYKLKTFYIVKRYNMTYDEGLKLIEKYIKDCKSINLRFDGFINEKKVKTVIRENIKDYQYLIEISSKELVIGPTYDATRVTVKKVDQNKKVLLNSFDSIKIEANGCIKLIGPSEVNLLGGQVSFWVRTIGSKGVGTIKVQSDNELIETVIVN